MNLTEFIKELEKIRTDHGDLEVVTDDYAGGDYDLHFANPEVLSGDSRALTPVVVINGRGRY